MTAKTFLTTMNISIENCQVMKIFYCYGECFGSFQTITMYLALLDAFLTAVTIFFLTATDLQRQKPILFITCCRINS